MDMGSRQGDAYKRDKRDKKLVKVTHKEGGEGGDVIVVTMGPHLTSYPHVRAHTCIIKYKDHVCM